MQHGKVGPFWGVSFCPLDLQQLGFQTNLYICRDISSWLYIHVFENSLVILFGLLLMTGLESRSSGLLLGLEASVHDASRCRLLMFLSVCCLARHASTGSERRDHHDDFIYHNGVFQGSEEFFSTISEPRCIIPWSVMGWKSGSLELLVFTVQTTCWNSWLTDDGTHGFGNEQT